MHINDIPQSSAAPPDAARPARRGGASPPDGTRRDSAGDLVTMSSRAQAISEIRAAALAAPEVRLEVVQEMRARLDRGALGPAPAEIARALVAQGVIG